MKHPELTAILSDTSFSRILMDGLAIAHTDTTHFTNRLVACWNACREFDDPVKGVAALQEDNADWLREFRAAQAHARVMDDQHYELLKLNKSNNEEIDRLRFANESLSDKLNANLQAQSDRERGICDVSRPEVNMQWGAHHPLFTRFDIIGPGLASGHGDAGKIQPLTDSIEESLKTLADLVELWKRNRSKGRSAVSIRGAILLTVEEINRLTAGCQTK